MGSSTRNKNIYFLLFSAVLCVWLCGSNATEAGFKIFRSERDIFTNLNCTDSPCTNSTQRCEIYNAECVSSTCEYCRCLEGVNTLTIIEDGKIKCKKDEEIVPESVPLEAFSLKNDQFHQCLKSNQGNKYITGVYCDKSPTSDMLWIWRSIKGNKQFLINVKTLKCVKRIGDLRAVTMEQCDNKSKSQKILCIPKIKSEINIGWKNQGLLHFYDWWGTSYASSQKLRWWCWWCKSQSWSSEKVSETCKTSNDYKGCYRFSDGSFMKYLDYSQTNPTLKISAPIFKKHSHNCKVSEIFKFIRDGKEWKGNGSDHFYISATPNGDTKVLQIKSMENLKVWNGSLLILNISCEKEKSEEVHCILLKLKSLPPYPEVFPTLNQIATHNYRSTREVPSKFPWVNSTPPITTRRRDSQFTKDQKTPTKSPSQSPTPTTYTTENPQESFNEETSKSHGTNSTVFAIAIPVTVTLLLVALALALLYNKKRKRARVPQSNNNDLAAVSYSEEIYEDPDRVYETTEDGKEPLNQPGNAMSSSTYCYPGMDIINNPAGTEQEYTYAKDLARSRVTSEVAAEEPISNGVLYETLEQPGQPTDGNFYKDPDDTNIIRKGLPELEYTYANDTDLPRDTADEKAVSEKDSAATSSGLYHTLEEEEPTPREHEYSYAKNTDMPSIPQSIVQRSNSPSPNSSLYHTLEEPNPPQAPVYSTLEEPEDLQNHK